MDSKAAIPPDIVEVQKCFEQYDDAASVLNIHIHTEKVAVENLCQNRDVGGKVSNGEVNTDGIYTDGFKAVSDKTATLVLSYKDLQDRYQSLKHSVHKVFQSRFDTQLLNRIESGSEKTGHIKALSDNAEYSKRVQSKFHVLPIETREFGSPQIRDEHVDSEPFDQEASSDITKSLKKHSMKGPTEFDQQKQDVDVSGYDCIDGLLLDCINDHFKTIRRTMYAQKSAMDQQSRQKLQLQLYHKRNDELMNVIVREFESKLKREMESVDVGIDVRQCANASKLKPDIPVLVLCISTFIDESDVRSSLAEMKYTKQNALLVFHHREMNIKRTKDQVDFGRDLGGGIFDVVFKENEGICTYDFDIKTLESLRDFITKQPVTGPKDTEGFPGKDTLSDEDWVSITNNYAQLKKCVNDPVANTIDTNSKDKSDLSEPSLLPAIDKIVIKSNETFEMQDASQSRYREKETALVTPCVLVQLKQAKIENNRLKGRIIELTEENDKYKMKKERQTERLVPLQLYYEHNKYLTEEHVNALHSTLTREMESYDVDIEIVQCTDSSQIKASIPVLVLCTYTKGHTFSADKALAGIKRTKHTILLIFHPMDKQDVKKRKSEAAESYLGCIFDSAYLQNNGLYRFDKKSLGNVCEFIKEHMPVQLQFYHKRNDELTKAVVKELELMIKCQMESVGVDIDVTQCTNASKLKPGIPVLVICFATSRVVTDVENASTEIKRTSQTALVVFHHKDKHVKIMRTSDQVTGKDLGGIFDFAFLQKKGIYTCDHNTKALESLRDFITNQRE